LCFYDLFTNEFAEKPGFSLVSWDLPGLSWIKTRFLIFFSAELQTVIKVG